MKFLELTIKRQQWGIDKDKILGEITFENQYSKFTVKLSEEKSLRMLEIVAENVVENAHEVGNLLVSAMQRPIAEIEGEVQ